MWFGIDHNHSHICLKVIDNDTFQMWALPYYMIEEVFHREVMSWLDIYSMETLESVQYSLEGLMPQDLSSVSASSQKHLNSPISNLQPLVKRLRTCLSSGHATVSTIESLVSILVVTTYIPDAIIFQGQYFKPRALALVSMALSSSTPIVVSDVYPIIFPLVDLSNVEPTLSLASE